MTSQFSRNCHTGEAMASPIYTSYINLYKDFSLDRFLIFYRCKPSSCVNILNKPFCLECLKADNIHFLLVNC